MDKETRLLRARDNAPFWLVGATATMMAVVLLGATFVPSTAAQVPDEGYATTDDGFDPSVDEDEAFLEETFGISDETLADGDGSLFDAEQLAPEQPDFDLDFPFAHASLAPAAAPAPLGAAPAPSGRQTPAYYDEAIDFTETLETPTNVKGALAGHLAFIQSTYVTPSGNQEVERPDLVPDRNALLLFFPAKNDQTAISARIGTSVYKLVPPEYQPHHDGKRGNEAMVYSKRAWTAVIDATDMQPGMSIRFTNAAKQEGTIEASAFRFGPASEVTAIGISLGMLADAPKKKILEEGTNVEYAFDYYNKIPVTKYRFAAYEPITLDRVVLPNGTAYVGQSAAKGAPLGGDMRFYIAKLLIGTGISNANVGVSSKKVDELEPHPFQQTSIVWTQGTYTNQKTGGPQLIGHCCSGGNGQLILGADRGNEFSHEYGHEFGLGHDGGGSSKKRMTFNGAWGYDVLHDRLIANVRWTIPEPDGPLPWQFNTDPMTGGKVTGSVSKFSSYTPYAHWRIQRRLKNSRGWHDRKSPTGYTNWDPETQQTVTWPPRTGNLAVPQEVGTRTTTILGFYDPLGELPTWIAPALHANWGASFYPSELNKKSRQTDECTLTVAGKGPDRVVNLHRTRFKRDTMNMFHVNVPTRFKPTRATVQCGGKQLATLALKPPTGDVAPFIEVGGDAGMEAALRIPVPRFAPATSQETFDRNVSAVFGPIRPYSASVTPQVGMVYSYKGSYYQARSSKKTAPPGPNWRVIARNVDSQIKKTTIAVGENSKTYQRDDTSFAFVVANDQSGVLDSDVWRLGARNSKEKYGTVTVVGTDAQGRTTPIVLRVQMNGDRISNSGIGKNAKGYFVATFVPEDNGSVAKGTYDVDFEVQVQGFHAGTFEDAFRVTGPVTVG